MMRMLTWQLPLQPACNIKQDHQQLAAATQQSRSSTAILGQLMTAKEQQQQQQVASWTRMMTLSWLQLWQQV